MRKFIIISSFVIATGVMLACSVDSEDSNQLDTDSSPNKITETEDPTAESNLTASQEQAIGSAENYLTVSGFSRQGLIEQLEFEGFSKMDATFAVDYLDVDWKKQAVKTAESYLNHSHFSRQGLIDQLEFEGFTTEQAEYAVDEVGL